MGTLLTSQASSTAASAAADGYDPTTGTYTIGGKTYRPASSMGGDATFTGLTPGSGQQLYVQFTPGNAEGGGYAGGWSSTTGTAANNYGYPSASGFVAAPGDMPGANSITNLNIQWPDSGGALGAIERGVQGIAPVAIAALGGAEGASLLGGGASAGGAAAAAGGDTGLSTLGGSVSSAADAFGTGGAQVAGDAVSAGAAQAGAQAATAAADASTAAADQSYQSLLNSWTSDATATNAAWSANGSFLDQLTGMLTNAAGGLGSSLLNGLGSAVAGSLINKLLVGTPSIPTMPTIPALPQVQQAPSASSVVGGLGGPGAGGGAPGVAATFLSGSGGVNPQQLILGRTTLLGS